MAIETTDEVAGSSTSSNLYMSYLASYLLEGVLTGSVAVNQPKHIMKVRVGHKFSSTQYCNRMLRYLTFRPQICACSVVGKTCDHVPANRWWQHHRSLLPHERCEACLGATLSTDCPREPNPSTHPDDMIDLSTRTFFKPGTTYDARSLTC